MYTFQYKNKILEIKCFDKYSNNKHPYTTPTEVQFHTVFIFFYYYSMVTPSAAQITDYDY